MAAVKRDQRGPLAPNWRGGRIVDPSGYVRVSAPEHPCAWRNGYIFEHRLVMEAAIGRRLLPGENVHHINGIKDDNRLENLELWDQGQPPGQRVADRIAWCEAYLERHRPG